MHHFQHVVQQLVELQRYQLQLRLACFDLGQFQDIVDQRQQMVAGTIDDIEVAPVVSGDLAGIGHHLRKADHRIERRPQFVAHIGQKHALGAIGCLSIAQRDRQRSGALLDQMFELVAMLQQLLLGALALGDLGIATARQTPPHGRQPHQPHLARKAAPIERAHGTFEHQFLATQAAQRIAHHRACGALLHRVHIQIDQLHAQ